MKRIVHDTGVVEVVGPVTAGEDPNADIVTCGECGRSWDDSVTTAWTPAPSARCPFEYQHGMTRHPAGRAQGEKRGAGLFDLRSLSTATLSALRAAVMDLPLGSYNVHESRFHAAVIRILSERGAL